MLRSPHPYRQDIDGLRAVAVLLVIMHHVAPDLLPGGFVGVDMFFVISGFLVTRLIDDAMQSGSFSYLDFILRRGRRIVPGLVTVLTGTMLLGACMLTGPELSELARHVAAASFGAANLLLWHEVGYFDTSAALKPLLHLWSLGVEEQFYLLWPVLLGFLPMQRRTRFLGICAAVLFSLLVSENVAYADPAQAFYMLHARAWELGAGGMLALGLPLLRTCSLRPCLARRVMANGMSIIGMLLVVGAAWRVTNSTTWPGIAALAPVIGAALVIASGPDAWLNHVVLSASPAQWIGQRSYSLYLWHWPPLAFLHILAQERQLDADTTHAIALCLMLPVAVLAHLTFRFVEQPFRRPRHMLAPHDLRVRQLVPFGLALSTMLVAAVAIVSQHGFPSRYGTSAGSDATAMLRNASTDSITAYRRIAERCQLPDKGHATWCWRVPGTGRGIAVIGDSHAEVIFAGLASSLQRAPLFLTGRKGCAPILTEYEIRERTGEICRRASRLAHDAIIRDTTIGTVLIVARGPAYLSGAGFGVDSQRAVVPVADIGTAADSLMLREAFTRGLERSVHAFTSADKRVILVYGVPEIGFLPEECVIGRPFGLRVPRQPCSITRAVYDRRNRAFRRLVADVALRLPALETFDAAPLFCDSLTCSARRHDRLLYQDGNHLTMDGSRVVTARLLPIMAGRPATALVAARGLAR